MPSPSDFDNLCDYVAWWIEDRNIFRHNEKSKTRWKSALCKILGIGDITKQECCTLESVAQQLGITKQAVHVTVTKINGILASDAGGYFKPFIDTIFDFFKTKCGVAKVEDLVCYVRQTFGWKTAVADGIFATFKCLGKHPEQYGDLCTGEVDDEMMSLYSNFINQADCADASDKLEYIGMKNNGLSQEINPLMYEFFIRRSLDRRDFKSELAVQFFTRRFTPENATRHPRTLRNEAILSVLTKAGYRGLTLDELFMRVEQGWSDLNLTIDGLRGFIYTPLDNKGTKILMYDRGGPNGDRTQYSLTTFFMDEATRRLLQEAAQKIKDYMLSSGFGIVDVWKTWDEYRSSMPIPLPKLGFYMMMKEIGAGGLVYPKYPRIAYPGIEYTEGAYSWELYRYYTGKGQYTISRGECIKFIAEKLHEDPLNASANEFSALNLVKKDNHDSLYFLTRPKDLDSSPKVMLCDIDVNPTKREIS